jgi:hypothetical protein
MLQLRLWITFDRLQFGRVRVSLIAFALLKALPLFGRLFIPFGQAAAFCWLRAVPFPRDKWDGARLMADQHAVPHLQRRGALHNGGLLGQHRAH